jgi:hypothetical protein
MQRLGYIGARRGIAAHRPSTALGSLMADSDFDMRQHRETYDNVMKLTGFTVLAILIIVLGLAFGLVGNAGWTALIAMFLGLIVLTIVAAVRS